MSLTGTVKVLSVQYYDTYDFLSLPGFTSLGYTTPESGLGTRYTASSKSLLTGVFNAEAGTGSEQVRVAMYYDYRGRMIQSRATNHLGGKNSEYVGYNFTDQPLRRKVVHAAPGKATQTEYYTYTYDHAGRLLTTKHKLNNGTEVVLASNTYDELGRLKTEKKGDLPASAYTYNVRSWTQNISNTHFNENLTYTYAGNIATQQWAQAGKTRKYAFDYDPLSRLKSAAYTGDGSYGTSYSYDKHGNMKTLQRYGNTGTSTHGLIDNLTMTYNGNQLFKVEDAAGVPALGTSADFRNGVNQTTEYQYDANGNMTKDLNKGISNITYNSLNLPSSLTIGGVTNSYKYAADGTKLRVTKGVSTTDYVNNVIYENGVLKRILVDGGYIENGVYYFYLTDHLGNNRVVANQSGSIVQSTQYYPYGMAFADGTNAGSQPYKYNGKELDSANGLNLYDYEARYMEPALGRFTTMDPLAEKYYGVSPYAYCAGNPVRYVDPTGMFYGDPPPSWGQSFWSGFTKPFKDFGEAVSHPVETVKNVVNSIETATPIDLGIGIGDRLLRSPISPLSGILKQLDVVKSVAYDQVNGTTTSAGVIGNQWGDIAFDVTTMAVGAGAGKAAGMVGNVVGKTAKTTQTATAIKEGTQVLKPVHGNSLQSVRPTWGYKLYSNDGTFLKNGITSKPIPQTRYTKTFMQTHDMKPIQLFPNRRAAWNWEYQQNLIQKGPLNKNMH